jgi:hypothetical protein
MPIKGLTDRGLAFPEIGVVRKGAKKTDPKKPGPDLTYFRVVFDEREAEAQDEFLRIYGPQPAEIKIILPFNEIERQWEAWLEAYTAGRMVARSDGEWFVYLVDTANGQVLVKNGIDLKTGQPRPYVDGPVGWYTTQKGEKEPIYCKPTGRLKVIIPELQRAAYLTVLTNSIHDIANLSDQLRAFQTINQGVLAGIPLVLRRRPRNISTPNADGTRVRRVKWLLSIEADPEWVKARLMATKQAALPGNGLALLPEGESEVEAAGLSYSGRYEDDEAEEGHYTETGATPPEPEGRPEENAVPAEGRPYPPEQVKAKMEQYARLAEVNGWVLKDGARNMIAVNLEACFAGEDGAEDKRRTVLKWLTGQAHVKDLSVAQALAIIKWLDARPDSGGLWTPDGRSIQEARAICSLALQQEGQLPLI